MKKILFISTVALAAILVLALMFGRGWVTRLNDSAPAKLVYEIDHSFDGDVIVIGAGASGLAAANALQRHNVPFTILEATDHYGGRVQKDDSFADFPIDLGAEWIHHDAGILNRLIGADNDEPPVELIHYNPTDIQSWNGKSLRKASGIITRLGQWSFPEYKFKATTWYDFVDQHFAQNVKDNIIFGEPVVNIGYAGDEVVVTTKNDRTFTADKAIVTVSIGVLREGYINFEPAMAAERINAINGFDFLKGFKLFLKFNEDFYADIIEYNLENGDKTYFNAAFKKDAVDHVLCLLATGDIAEDYYKLGNEDAIVAAVLKELDEMYQGKASAAYSGDYRLKDWGRHVFTMGTWTDGDGGKNNLKLASAPLEDKVYFAGAAFENHGQMATVHGAIMSGYDVAFELLSPYAD